MADKFVLNEKQEAAVTLATLGANLFVTGGGGRGKSVVIEAVTNSTTLVVASTAQAALNVGGKTIHSAFGISAKKVITPNSKTYAKLKVVPSRLIIDEVGTVRSDYLDYMDRCLRRTTGVKEPFGGIQVIMVGDFFQTPPIVTHSEAHLFRDTSPYAFDSKVWKEMEKMDIVLDKSERQSNEEHARILDEIRVCGERTPLAVRKVNIYSTLYDHRLHSEITMLCFRNAQADNHNSRMFNQIQSEARFYPSEITGKINSAKAIPEGVSLKVGAKVIITGNKYDRTVSEDPIHYTGQQGEVISLGVDYIVVLDSKGKRIYVDYLIKEFYDMNSKGERILTGTLKSIPVKLGWAITVHAAQGITLDSAVLDTGQGAFTTGLMYVALSRVRSLNNLVLKQALRVSDVKVDPRVVAFYKNL